MQIVVAGTIEAAAGLVAAKKRMVLTCLWHVLLARYCGTIRLINLKRHIDYFSK